MSGSKRGCDEWARWIDALNAFVADSAGDAIVWIVCDVVRSAAVNDPIVVRPFGS